MQVEALIKEAIAVANNTVVDPETILYDLGLEYTIAYYIKQKRYDILQQIVNRADLINKYNEYKLKTECELKSCGMSYIETIKDLEDLVMTAKTLGTLEALLGLVNEKT